MIVHCEYCGNQAKLVTGKEIYPHRSDLFKLRFYQCSPCDAYVGTHKGTIKPLGRLADKELRTWKSEAHKAFDPLWKSGKMKRSRAYAWLASQLCIPTNKCHIGMFDISTCRKVVALCSFGCEFEGI